MNGRTVNIIDADANASHGDCLFEKAGLDRRVVLHRTMPVEVIRRQVGEDCKIGRKTGRELDLIGRDFENINRVRARRLEIEYRISDIATDLSAVAA